MEEITRLAILAKSDPIIFIDRFFYTFNPKEEPYHFPFRLYPFQKELVKTLQYHIDNGLDIFIEKCRDMGATYTVIAVILWYWRYVPGSNFLLGSRKESYVDNTGTTTLDEQSNKEESLFGKIEYMLNHLPLFMLPKGFSYRKHQTFMSLINPENGNVISGESANRNFSRGGRFKAILLDEFAFWENDSAAWGSTADTTNCRIALTTPGIRPSKAKRLKKGTDGEKIDIVSLTYDLDPRKTQAWLDKERGRRSPDDFAREIMIDWDRSMGDVIYREFDPSIHFIGYTHEYNKHGTYYYGLDFAVRGFTACVPIYIGTDGNIIVLDEYKQETKTAQQHAVAIKEMLRKYAPLDQWVGFADPAGFAKNQQKGDLIWSLADEYYDEGLGVVKANNEVTAGINFVRQLIGSNKVFVNNTCEKFLNEINEYRWMEQAETQVGRVDEAEKVRKMNDHLMDAFRYVLYTKPVTPEEKAPELPYKAGMLLEFPSWNDTSHIKTPQSENDNPNRDKFDVI